MSGFVTVIVKPVVTPYGDPNNAMIDPELVQLLKRLVAVPSVNPMLAEDPETGGEARMSRFLADHLERTGWDVEWHELIPGRPNVVGRFGPKSPKRTLMFESHLDTQGIHGMTVPPFGGEVRDGRLYGRGACDTKGPMAATLHVLKPKMMQEMADAGVGLLFIGAVGEEKGNVGAEQLVDLGVGADEAIVLEPTDLNIVHAHKGTYWFEVEVRGRAAHGSNPDLGQNAIYAMSDVLKAIRDQVAEACKVHSHPLLNKPTANIGLIRGGSSINIVPDRCIIEVDRRTLPGESHDDIKAAVKACLARLEAADQISGWAIHPIKEGIPFATTSDSALVRRLLTSCAAEGIQSKAEGAAWYSDAGPFSRTCREIAVFGPGSIRQAHTADEFIELDSLEQGVRILTTFLRQLAAEA